MPTIDQETAVKGDEPTDTLSTIRGGDLLGWTPHDKTWKHAVFFGANVLAPVPGRLAVGDAMVVKETRPAGSPDFPPA